MRLKRRYSAVGSAALAAVAFAVIMGALPHDALAAPSCNLSVSPSIGIAPQRVSVRVYSQSDSTVGGPVALWLDIDFKHAGMSPTEVTRGTPTGADYTTAIRFASGGVHHFWAACGSGTGNSTATADVLLLDPLGIVAFAASTIAVALAVVLWLRSRRQRLLWLTEDLAATAQEILDNRSIYLAQTHSSGTDRVDADASAGANAGDAAIGGLATGRDIETGGQVMSAQVAGYDSPWR